MGLISTIKRWLNMIFASKAKDEFNIKSITSAQHDHFVDRCAQIYKGNPYWIADAEDEIKTVNFARFICAETAKLSTLGMSIIIEGDSDRAKELQRQIDGLKGNIRQWVEYCGAYGTVVIKPNGLDVEAVLPSKFVITEQRAGKVTGAVFLDQQAADNGNEWFTRLEYHRFVGDDYVITNKCYRGSSANDMGNPIDIKDSPWSDMLPEVGIAGLDSPLFGVLKMPNANYIDMDSPLTLPIFSDAIEELKDLDTAYSRNASEIFDSERMVLLDADRLVPMAGAHYQTAEGKRERASKMKLPHYVNIVEGSEADKEIYHEINPTLNTQTRIEGINSLLSQIGFKCGFSNGYFVFNESTGFSTATQVTADQARTIQLIEDIRRNIDMCMIDVVKAVNVFEDLYGTTGHMDIPDTIETDELDRVIHIHFDPIYTNKEEDRQRMLTLANSGYVPKWYYLHMYEGMSEEQAKALTEEAQPKESGLFGEE